MSSESPETPRLVSVTNGGVCTGFFFPRGPCGVEAFDANNKSLGIFADATSAATAVEKSVAPLADVIRFTARKSAGAA